jgi:AraC family transcriptional activator of mtrCDE
MKAEADAERLGATAILNGLSSALFALTLRQASEIERQTTGLLALAGHPRLSPALAAIVGNPAHPWTLPELADLCHMSRATMIRHFKEKVGRSAADLLLDIRMGIALSALRKPGASTALVGEMVGYQSEAAFQRAFKQHVGVTPAQWRRSGDASVP